MNNETLFREKIDQAWDRAWKHFFRPETNLFYDTLFSDDPATEMAALPTPEEVQRQYPNQCGWNTGMEDSMITGGSVLSMLCDRYDVTGDKTLIEYAAKVFSGMCSCLEIHGTPGFLARSICLFDRKSVYINSSRDQYTHFVHGLWKFYHSPLSNEEQREHVKRCFRDIARYMDKCITPENNYSILRLDGTKEKVDVCKMVGVCPHEAARLSMFYIAAFEVTQESHWLERYLYYAPEAARRSTDPEPVTIHPFCLMQKICSLEVILAIDHDHPEITALFDKARQEVYEVCELAAKLNGDVYRRSDPCLIPVDWRTLPMPPRTSNKEEPYNVPAFTQAQKDAFEGLRGVGELALSCLIAAHKLPPTCKKELEEAILNTDFTRIHCRSLYFPQAAYWSALKYGVEL